MKKRALFVGIVLSLAALMGCVAQKSATSGNEIRQPDAHDGSVPAMQTNRQLLENFIADRLTGSDGVYTNYIDTDQSSDVATGHEVLSESAGLLLRYYARTGQQQAFDEAWSRALQSFDRKTGFSYRYSPKLDKRFSMNAAIDDLRMLRALHEAAGTFGDERYRETADKYGSRFYRYNVKENHLYDFYDEAYEMTNSFITLCYIDLYALQLLPLPSEQQQNLIRNMSNIAQQGYLSDTFPFYETRYRYDSQSYESDDINTVESLLTILHLAEVRQHQPASIKYLKDHVNAGTLYGRYTRAGVPANQVQSTAIYAIAAMIGAQVDDKELYDSSLKRMHAFQVRDADSPLYGGYGDVSTLQAYSFDNLTALLAYTYETAQGKRAMK